MQKQAPSIGRILVAVGFALSCFALLLFLWVTFGGSVPFKPASYKFTADFPEAITLQKEADVRIGGVSVGKVKELELPEDENATRAVIEIDPEYAPISSDARAILRQKTLLGETYVELTTGTQVTGQEEEDDSAGGTATAQSGTIDVGEISGDDAPEAIEEGGHLEDSQVADQTQIDEIFNALDEETRQAFQLWMKNSGIAINGRGLDLNDALGSFGPFSEDATDVLETLREQEQALRGVVRNTGAVFQAITAREEALTGAVLGSQRTLRGLASRDEALAETFRILPTFQIESRLTLERLERFAEKAGPLFRDLRPVARDVSPTLRDVRRLAPHLRRLFKNLDPLIKASATGLPSLRRFLDQLRPVMANLDPFLANFTPIVRYLDFYAPVVTDFISNPAFATAGALPPTANQTEPRHISRQLASLTEPHAEALSIWPNRLPSNRGNGYLLPFAMGNPASAEQGQVVPDFDCNHTGANGGLGSGQVTPAPNVYGEGGPASNPPAQEGVYPINSPILPALGGGSGLFSQPPFDTLPPPLGGPGGILEGLDPTDLTNNAIARAPCVLQTTTMGNFPVEFGGGRLPQVLADP
jgi:phospholipid/cholesterol/gamma-HCH transport system substrate-binding protein